MWRMQFTGDMSSSTMFHQISETVNRHLRSESFSIQKSTRTPKTLIFEPCRIFCIKVQWSEAHENSKRLWRTESKLLLVPCLRQILGCQQIWMQRNPQQKLHHLTHQHFGTGVFRNQRWIRSGANFLLTSTGHQSDQMWSVTFQMAKLWSWPCHLPIIQQGKLYNNIWCSTFFINIIKSMDLRAPRWNAVEKPCWKSSPKSWKRRRGGCATTALRPRGTAPWGSSNW